MELRLIRVINITVLCIIMSSKFPFDNYLQITIYDVVLNLVVFLVPNLASVNLILPDVF